MSGEPFEVLLIEDDPDHAELVKRSFKENQVANRIHLAEDGEKALDYMYRRGDYSDPESSPRPDVILLDLRLPKIDGLAVLKEIKTDEKYRTIPVVILTTSDADTDVSRAYDLNANSYIVKPVDFAKFTQLMTDLGFYWLGWNRLPWPAPVNNVK